MRVLHCNFKSNNSDGDLMSKFNIYWTYFNRFQREIWTMPGQSVGYFYFRLIQKVVKYFVTKPTNQ